MSPIIVSGGSGSSSVVASGWASHSGCSSATNGAKTSLVFLNPSRAISTTASEIPASRSPSKAAAGSPRRGCSWGDGRRFVPSAYQRAKARMGSGSDPVAMEIRSPVLRLAKSARACAKAKWFSAVQQQVVSSAAFRGAGQAADEERGHLPFVPEARPETLPR